MQAFYTRLTSNQDLYWISLARLTRVSLNQIKALSRDLTWSIWG
jgi:hypothetical protein